MKLIRRAAILAGATAAVAAVMIPAAAHADPIGWGGTLRPGQSYCFLRNAGPEVYQIRAEATATNAGARFRFIRNGVVLQATDSDSRRQFSAERRTSTGDYPGPGVYQLCAANHATTDTLVNLHILVNNEFI
jgi:hypothetical protein